MLTASPYDVEAAVSLAIELPGYRFLSGWICGDEVENGISIS